MEHLAYAKERKISVSIDIGILRNNKAFIHDHPSAWAALFYIAEHFDCRVFAFSPEDVDYDREVIRGTFLEGTRKVVRMTNIPDVVDNYPHKTKNRRLLEYLNSRSRVIREPLGMTKDQVFEMIRADQRYADLLIPTFAVGSVAEVRRLLEAHNGELILKPLRGRRGRGVILVRQTGMKFAICAETSYDDLTDSELSRILMPILRERYIAQEYILSRTKDGSPFDIRIHARKGAEGRFKVNLYPRIGNPDGVTSNLATGGFSMKLDRFLRLQFEDQWMEVKDKLKILGEEFPNYFADRVHRKIFDIGLDVGISRSDDEWRLHLFEVNTYLNGRYFVMQDAITHLQYYKYIANKSIDEFSANLR